MTLVITAFISFHNNGFPSDFSENGRLIPTECDFLLSALGPFRNSQMFQVRVYDLETPSGRLRGFLNGVTESPAVIIAEQRHIGLTAVEDALDRLLYDEQMTQEVT